MPPEIRESSATRLTGIQKIDLSFNNIVLLDGIERNTASFTQLLQAAATSEPDKQPAHFVAAIHSTELHHVSQQSLKTCHCAAGQFNTDRICDY